MSDPKAEYSRVVCEVCGCEANIVFVESEREERLPGYYRQYINPPRNKLRAFCRQHDPGDRSLNRINHGHIDYRG